MPSHIGYYRPQAAREVPGGRRETTMTTIARSSASGLAAAEALHDLLLGLSEDRFDFMDSAEITDLTCGPTFGGGLVTLTLSNGTVLSISVDDITPA